MSNICAVVITEGGCAKSSQTGLCQTALPTKKHSVIFRFFEGWKEEMPGRPRKPLKSLQLSGTYREDRHGGRHDFTLPNEIPEPADYFTEDMRNEWKLLVRDSAYSKVLAKVDRGMIELYCVLRSEFVKHVRAGTEMPAARLSVLANAASKLGLSPADRGRVNAPAAEKPTNEFRELAAEAIRLRHGAK